MNKPDLHNYIVGLQPSLMSMAISLTPNRDDADDLVQDTILTALSSDATVNIEHHNLKNWLLTILRHLFHNEYHRTKRLGITWDTCDESNPCLADGFTGLSRPDEAIARIEVTEALANIDEEGRRPFSMYLAGYKYVEIARHLGVPLGTIKSRISATRARLQQQLADYR